MNMNKTQRLLFSLKHLPDNDTLSNVKLLGIHLDSKLTWSEHIDSICVRLSRVIYLLRHLKQLISKVHLKSAYYGFFHNILSYGIHIWGNGSNISKLLCLQKKAVRILTGSPYDAHCRPLFIDEGILTVINLYIYHCLVRVKRNLNQFIDRIQIHNYPTRYNYLLALPPVRLTKSKNWFDFMSIKMFNKLPQEAHTTNINRFETVLFCWLINNPFYNIKEFFESNVIISF